MIDYGVENDGKLYGRAPANFTNICSMRFQRASLHSDLAVAAFCRNILTMQTFRGDAQNLGISSGKKYVTDYMTFAISFTFHNFSKTVFISQSL